MKGKCPTCHSEREGIKENKWFPFCCQRCKMVDLYYWLSGDYCISESLPKSLDDEEEVSEKF
jgi:endogenous inhibitor of DNA gyrase (YacG/DUF329 family)